MNEYVVAMLLFGSAFALLVSGIPIWALGGISGHINYIYSHFFAASFRDRSVCAAWEHG
jgi:hypothetical protein